MISWWYGYYTWLKTKHWKEDSESSQKVNEQGMSNSSHSKGCSHYNIWATAMSGWYLLNLIFKEIHNGKHVSIQYHLNKTARVKFLWKDSAPNFVYCCYNHINLLQNIKHIKTEQSTRCIKKRSTFILNCYYNHLGSWNIKKKKKILKQKDVVYKFIWSNYKNKHAKHSKSARTYINWIFETLIEVDLVVSRSKTFNI